MTIGASSLVLAMFKSRDWKCIKDARVRRSVVVAVTNLHKLQRELEDQQDRLDRIIEDLVLIDPDLEYEVLPELESISADIAYRSKLHWSESLK